MSTKLRPPTEDDVPAVIRLMSEHSPEPADDELVRRSWTSPEVRLDRDARLEDGSYAIVEDLGDGRAWIDLRGDPSPAMLDWAETRAGEIAPRLFAGAWSEHDSLLHSLAQRGFRLIRHSHRMEIDLSEPTPAPEWPSGIETRTFRSGDDPAGVAICHPHQTADALGWIRILGVRRSWRRRGLGRALLLQAFTAFRERGLVRAGLGVDAQSVTGANRLYEEAGMHVTARFDVYEKVVS